MHILCPHCRNPIEVVKLSAREEISCPSCGSSFHLESGSTTGPATGAGQKLGKFELIDVVGQGAFGTVYKARDAELDRVVAIKVPRAGNLAGPQELDRFLREARSAGQLRHPSIVSVHDVGQSDGVPFLVSDFAQGVTLTDLLSARRPGFRESAHLVAAIADALHYAHQQGVVHRDLKPSNIMVGEDGRPCVMDFGLAKRDSGEITMTVEGQVLGTPAYMPPEQARGEGHTVDARGDVYSLGVVLYQLLTGELPFRGTARMLLHQVLHDEPRSPHSLNDRVPRDLDTIALKSMAKEPVKRYATAQEMADDLRSWLNGEAIRARPVGRLERLVRWCKREPVVAGLLATVLVVLTAGVVASSYFAYAANQEAKAAGEAEKEAKGRAEAEAEAKAVAQNERTRAEAEKARAERLVYAGKLSLAQDYWPDKPLAALNLLDDCQWNLRGWEYRHLWSLYNSNQATFRCHANLVNSVAWSPDGKRIVSGGCGFGRDSKKRRGEVRVWNAETGQEVLSLKGHMTLVTSVAFSPDGNRIVSGGGEFNETGELKVWGADKGQEVLTLKGHTNWVTSVAFSPDGKRIVSGSSDMMLKVWDAETGQKALTLKGHTFAVRSVAYSPDGKRIVSGSYDNTLKVWDAETGHEVLSLKGHTFEVSGVAFSPDGKRIVSGSGDGMLKVWDADKGHEVLSLKGHTSRVNSVAFSPDDKRIVSGSNDCTVRVWDASKGQELLTLKGHTSEVCSVSFCPDGKRIVSGSWDRTLKVWDAGNGQEVLTLKGHASQVNSVAWSPDGQRIVSGDQDGTLKVWDGHKGQSFLTLKGHTALVVSVAYSPDGKRINGKDEYGKALTWDTMTGQLLPDADPMPQREKTEAISPDGSLRAFIESGQIRIAAVAELARQQEKDRAFLERLARPDPAYHRQKADLYEKSGDLFAAAFQLRRLLLIEPKDDALRKRLAAVEARLAQAKSDAPLP